VFFGVEAVGPSPAELFQGFIETAADGGFVAAELGEGIDGTAVVIECSAELAGGFLVFLAGIGRRFVFFFVVFVLVAGLVFADGFKAGSKEAGFDPLETVHAPLGDGHLTDQVFLMGADGPMFDVERGEKLMEGVRILFGQEGGSRGEAMLEGVSAGGGEALRSGWAVGTATVFPVGADLFERRHGERLPPVEG
jgi:hypothetical protein